MRKSRLLPNFNTTLKYYRKEYVWLNFYFMLTLKIDLDPHEIYGP